MSRIAHFKLQPVNVQFWDYYILCRLNAKAAICLQRMEYWDGTKEDGNTHAEDINDSLERAGKEPTQDTSNWIYKAQDALAWELMGIVGERKMPAMVSFLVDDLKYLTMRNNPHNTWDRKKQYAFHAQVIQEHINYLGYIISFFNMPVRRLIPVFYAIEDLTRDGVFIEKLNVKAVLTKLEGWKENAEKLPHFLKEEISKFFSSFSTSAVRPFRTFAEWKAQNCGMHTAKTRNRNRKNAESIPQKCGSNSIEYIHRGQNIEDKHNEDTKENAHVSDDTHATHAFDNSSKENPLEVSQPEKHKTNAQAEERTPKQASDVAYSQESTQKEPSQDKDTKPTEQPTLLAPPEKPEMPPKSMRWGPEKMVQITEAFIGKYYDELVRPDEIKAAQKIMKRGATEEKYVQAYCKRNNQWWHERKGQLNVSHMAARTPRGQMRFIELLSELGDTSSEIKQTTQTAAALAEAQAQANESNEAELEKLLAKIPASQAKKFA